MAVTKVLARDYTFEIQTGGTDVTPVWTRINGINKFGFANSANQTDTTTFDNGGRNTHLITSRGSTMSLEGFVLEDMADGTRDPGQQAVEDLAYQIGPASIGRFRMTTPGKKTTEFTASANVTSAAGGGNDDGSAWNVEITMSGDLDRN